MTLTVPSRRNTNENRHTLLSTTFQLSKFIENAGCTTIVGSVEVPDPLHLRRPAVDLQTSQGDRARRIARVESDLLSSLLAVSFVTALPHPKLRRGDAMSLAEHSGQFLWVRKPDRLGDLRDRLGSKKAPLHFDRPDLNQPLLQREAHRSSEYAPQFSRSQPDPLGHSASAVTCIPRMLRQASEIATSLAYQPDRTAGRDLNRQPHPSVASAWFAAPVALTRQRITASKTFRALGPIWRLFHYVTSFTDTPCKRSPERVICPLSGADNKQGADSPSNTTSPMESQADRQETDAT